MKVIDPSQMMNEVSARFVNLSSYTFSELHGYGQSMKGVCGVVEKEETGLFWAVRVVGSTKGLFIRPEGIELVSDVADTELPVSVMHQLWTTRDSSGDVKLAAPGGEQAVIAHACVLGAASPVLAAAFASGMKESATKQIDIQDTSLETIHGVLQLLYTGSRPDGFDLLEALAFADKYQLTPVAKKLGVEAIAAITPENAALTVRLLKNVDDETSNILDQVFSMWSTDRNIMMAIMKGL